MDGGLWKVESRRGPWTRKGCRSRWHVSPPVLLLRFTSDVVSLAVTSINVRWWRFQSHHVQLLRTRTHQVRLLTCPSACSSSAPNAYSHGPAMCYIPILTENILRVEASRRGRRSKNSKQRAKGRESSASCCLMQNSISTLHVA